MLDCKLCNYYEVLDSEKAALGKGTARCEFSGVIFTEDVENLDIPYPCRGIPLTDYYKRINQPKQESSERLKLASK